MPGAGNAVLDFIDMVQGTDHKSVILDGFTHELEQRGFDSFASAEIPNPSEPMEPYVHVSTMPKGWVERYFSQRYVHVDPMARAVAMSQNPFTWTSLARERPFNPRENRVMKEAGEFGIVEGFAVPIHGHGGYNGAVTMGSSHVDLDRRHLNELHVMAVYLHGKLRQIHNTSIPDEELDIPVLSVRERECLHWVAKGKSNWDISQILGISEHTVHEHVERAKRKYGVPTRIQVVVAGIMRGEVRP